MKTGIGENTHTRHPGFGYKFRMVGSGASLSVFRGLEPDDSDSADLTHADSNDLLRQANRRLIPFAVAAANIWRRAGLAGLTGTRVTEAYQRATLDRRALRCAKVASTRKNSRRRMTGMRGNSQLEATVAGKKKTASKR